jgi:hypothetical protein
MTVFTSSHAWANLYMPSPSTATDKNRQTECLTALQREGLIYSKPGTDLFNEENTITCAENRKGLSLSLRDNVCLHAVVCACDK